MRSNSKIIVKAPGRICLFGDHQDYLGLPIIACAINRYITIKAISNTSEMFRIEMPDMKNARSFSIHEKFNTLEKGDYFASAIRVLNRYGCIPTCGYTLTITGTIPINAGLSSSSAVVVAWVHFLLETFGCTQEVNNDLIAKIAYEAEVLEHNSPGGRMDQYTIALGAIIFLETDETAAYQQINCNIEGLIIGESGIPKNTLGLLSDLKGNAIKAIDCVKKHVPDYKLSAATLSDIERYSTVLPEALIPYYYAAITNYSITQKAFKAMMKTELDYELIGQLMNEHHQVLKEVLKITTPKIDAMIDAALNAGAYGAKIVGSGGGGSICAISPKEKQQAVIDSICKAGGKDAYAVTIVPGSHTVTP